MYSHFNFEKFAREEDHVWIQNASLKRFGCSKFYVK